jgi:Family of unknown function (DUF6263)
MKKIYPFFIVLFCISCKNNNTNTFQILLQPQSVITKHYKTEQAIQNFITINGKEQNTYIKHMNEYAVTYTPVDSAVNLDIIFTNFRLEYEDGQGVQVFDTKFDKPDLVNLDARIFFIMKNKKVSALVSNKGLLMNIKGIASLKNQILTEYESLGFNKKVLVNVIDTFLNSFIKNQVLEENLLFYTRNPVAKDSSYFVSGTTRMPVFFSLSINYAIKSANETKTFLAGKGSAMLKDSSFMSNENMKTVLKNKEAELFDEVQLDQKTGILTYRKMFIGYSDSILFNNQRFPLRFTLEKELQEKKVE